jgi:hypothetical protein
MTTLTDEDDGLLGKRIVYIARKIEGPYLVRKNGRHRGLQGKLYDGEAYVDVAIEKAR